MLSQGGPLSQQSLLFASPPAARRGSIPLFSGFSCCVASSFHFIVSCSKAWGNTHNIVTLKLWTGLSRYQSPDPSLENQQVDTAVKTFQSLFDVCTTTHLTMKPFFVLRVTRVDPLFPSSPPLSCRVIHHWNTKFDMLFFFFEHLVASFVLRRATSRR